MTLAGLECRLAALHQTKQFRPSDPWWSLFTPQEIERQLTLSPGGTK